MSVNSTVVLGTISDSGGHPTGVTELISSSFIKLTASPSRKIWTSWPASAKAFACRKAKAAFVGSSEPHVLLTRIPQIDWAGRTEGRGNAGQTADSFFHPSGPSGFSHLIPPKSLV